ncbi:PilZ domain-containing protein [Aestuariibacter sp. A3R04]|uniref:PilZ domain-containing protein n=1 Tax=Aestuariibacter sp. A3R04 TaxID=2841571 RepID=UPI001C08B54D|nr:PilZ domain-containing protein [Aestuariibacter sp. A3R04]MBU3022949.1 flagellar brake protein [Aestuariibacter sp. A3R04]
MTQKDVQRLSKTDVDILTRLSPGTLVDLQIDTPTAPQRLKTYYVGTDIPNGFIFQVPNTHKWANIRDQLVAGNNVVVRFVIEGAVGQVIAFKVPILKCFSKPISILITGFPDTIQTLGLRSEQRAQPGIPVMVKMEEKETPDTKGLILDVSKTGCKLAIPVDEAKSVLEINKNITLGCTLDGEDISIACMVKNVSQDKGYHFYGIQFAIEQPAVERVIERHILA